jgi:hypothetical protein
MVCASGSIDGRRATAEEYEDFLLQLDSTFADMETAKRKGYLQRDRHLLKAVANDIYQRRDMIRSGKPL